MASFSSYRTPGPSFPEWSEEYFSSLPFMPYRCFPAILVSAAFFIFAVTKAISARLTKPTTGKEGIIGETGTVVVGLAPEGKVSIHGEYWNAMAAQPVEKGGKVQAIG